MTAYRIEKDLKSGCCGTYRRSIDVAELSKGSHPSSFISRVAEYRQVFSSGI